MVCLVTFTDPAVSRSEGPEWVEISGTVRNDEGVSLCTMVLANGQYTFSDSTTGEYDLRVPPDDNGEISILSFADGFAPYNYIMTPSEMPSESVISFDITMLTPGDDEPEVTVTNEISTAETNPGWAKITGQISLENEIPLCAMVLANGQHMFTCDPVGEYSLEVPADDNGQITIFGFADGFKPFKQTVEVNQDNIVPTVIPAGDEQYLNLDSDYIFDQDKLHTFELKISDSALAEIDADPSAEQYAEGSLTFEGETISPVGVRYKGSVGAFGGCLSGSNPLKPSGYKTCTKLSMKVKINWEGRDEKFYKLKKLQFHSQNADPSQMHERLGYWLFRSMGVPAPRSVHARLIINGVYSGIYALTEQIDSRFVKYNFEDDDGNLYKEVWPLSMGGIPHSDERYLTALKTNENDNPSVEIIKNFGQSIADANQDDLQSIIAESMNIDEIISYAVVDRMIRNDDGAFHWYWFGYPFQHNYYWYEEPNNQKLHLIPWDLDNAFDNIIDDNPVTAIADEWGQITNDCKPFRYGPYKIPQWSASCDKLTSGWASFTDDYNRLKAQFKEGPFSESQVNSLLDTWSDQIRNATEEAEETHGDALTVSEWERAVDKLKFQLEFARNN
ncbi:MAG: hypothetical protein GY795_46580 [Desulfobacterales bacterium]|nr:hypothetical protein [Desulfobacterales bacterium]